jgi:predicted transcriptional regulator
MDWQYLIQENISLPGHLLLKNSSYISSLRLKHKLTMREIARRLNTSHSAVIQALNRAGITKTLPSSPDRRKGQIPFGFDCIDFKLVKNMSEQEAIRIIRQMKITGLSLRACAREMNKRLIPAKNNGIWQANTVKKILDRAG